MCPKVSKKPKRGYFWDLGMLKFFPYKLTVIASLLYTISAYERYHRNALLLDGRGDLHSVNKYTVHMCSFYNSKLPKKENYKNLKLR